MAEICVVHLVRAANGLAPFRRFWESYQRLPAGVAHDLLIIYKGFADSGETGAYEAVMAGAPHKTLFLSDAGFDIVPYFTVARSFEYQCLCFLNSYSVILAGDWLRKLYDQAARPEVGLVGATGSWQSMYTDALVSAPREGKPLWKYLLYAVAGGFRPWFLHRSFVAFPNYHVRTNAFMMRREVMLRIRLPRIWCKYAAWRFESGRDGLSRQVEALGLKTVVVGRDGCGYERDAWDASLTYKQRHQENLLVADNQTMRYSAADQRERRLLSKMAWGDRAVVDGDA